MLPSEANGCRLPHAPNLLILRKPGVGIPPVTSKDLKAVQDVEGVGSTWKFFAVSLRGRSSVG
jgi:hypothetical protein